MSSYSFIAADYELPEVENSKERVITVKEAIELGIKPHEFMPWEKMNPNDKILFFEKESDLGELVIRKSNGYEENIRLYTDKPFIYSVGFRYTESRAKQLLKYLKENIIEGYQLELWCIWLGDKQNIKPNFKNYKEISLNDINQIYNFNNINYKHYSCMIIKR